jgi:uncharacterized membrane protein YidH (DUF202 family)
MFEVNKPWYYRSVSFFLSVSGSLVLFGIFSSAISLIFSWLANILDFKASIVNLQEWQVLLVISSSTFILMTICLYLSENYISRKLETLDKNTNSIFLVSISVILFVSVLVLFYFGFSNFLSFLYNNFWI